MHPDPDRSWIDVTRTLVKGILNWPGEQPFTLTRDAVISGPATSNTSTLHTCTHVGTHMDAPLHFIAGGADIASLPLSKLCGPATVLHLPDQRVVTATDLKAANIPLGDRVLLHTASAGHWSRPHFDPATFWAIAPDAARWLVERGTPLLGTDAPSIDAYDSPDYAAHYILLGAEVVIIEGLDLAGVAPGRYELVALPLRIADSDGSPARVIIRPWPGG